jgi:tRNA-splicing ligase RtcB
MSKKDKTRFDPNHSLKKAGYASHPQFIQLVREAGRLTKQGLDETQILAEIAQKFSRPDPLLEARAAPIPITLFGERGIDFEAGVMDQMLKAASLPVAVQAAIMPDGHPGYALPIGGVIALENAVSPSFVGYDIACRMTVSVLDISPDEFLKNREALAHDMRCVSSFGVGSGFLDKERRQHAVMDEPLWEEIPELRGHKPVAAKQLGSSGGGNHFFDALIGEVIAPADWMPLPVGTQFVAIMTHSGSRGTGNQLAQYYQKIAEVETKAIARGIPKGYEWLPLDRDSGREYWQVMQLIGRYAQANHHLIHDHFLKRSGLNQVARWENHHNFAFLEDGLVVHRKGATPAHKGRIGIIPGSSGTASYLVEGLGDENSLNSSSHGAGRPRSRTASRELYDDRQFKNYMKHHDILNFGVAPDETYKAYKDIEHVMTLQEGSLVRSIARLQPVVVIMGGHADDGD